MTTGKLESSKEQRAALQAGDEVWVRGKVYRTDMHTDYVEILDPPLPVVARLAFVRGSGNVLLASPANEQAAPAPKRESLTGAPAPQDEHADHGPFTSDHWRTVIVGLPIIRKLLNAEDVTLNDCHINLIPDDVLWNNQPKREAPILPPRDEEPATTVKTYGEESAGPRPQVTIRGVMASEPVCQFHDKPKIFCGDCAKEMVEPYQIEVPKFLAKLRDDMKAHQDEIIKRSNQQKGRARNRTRRYSAVMEGFIRYIESVLVPNDAIRALAASRREKPQE
jgi:hypothetical protein